MSGKDVKDSRFDKFKTDPKFRTIPKKAKKVQIDKRFESMFKDKRFLSAKVKVDKRGRPNRDFKPDENYRRYYNLNESSDESSEEDEEDKDQEAIASSSDERDVKGKKKKETSSAKIKSKLKDLTVDYARGEGCLDSSSSSSSEEEEDEEEVDQDEEDPDAFDKWGELDHDSERTTEATKRLAVCNMDWDRVQAQDLFLALSSFCGNGSGHLKSVAVYLSDFGRERIKEEDRLGPEELRKSAKDDGEDDLSDVDDTLDAKEMEKKAMERVRKYQVNRLKYYYAIAEFDSAVTANHVYTECDNTEYELSATRFDLRFVPDDMEFPSKKEATSFCDTAPDPTKYKPKLFETTALQKGKVELTWDEVDPERTRAMQRAFECSDDEDGNLDELKEYLASESSDEEAVGDREIAPGSSDDDDDDQDAIAKYRALLAGIQEKAEKKKEEEGDMEVTFASTDVVDKKMEEKRTEQMTPWEKYLHKKKEKKKSKRDAKKMAQQESKQSENQAFSDDEIPDGFASDDSFFNLDEDSDADESRTTKKKDKKRHKKGGKKAEEDGEANKELSLLVMDSDDDGKQHFDYKEIVKNETSSKKKRKQKMKKKKEEDSSKTDDTFKLDLGDSRFAAVFDDPDFNVDPSHPSFKKTKSMQDIIAEKQRRITAKDGEAPSPKKRKVQPKGSSSSTNDVDQLLKSVQLKVDKKGKMKKGKH